MSIKDMLSKIVIIEKDIPQTNITEETIIEKEIKPNLNELSQEEIKSIHSRGNITANEKVKEWENHGICAPLGNKNSNNTRCQKFNHNCHDCLIDFASNKKEYKPIEKLIQESDDMMGFNIYHDHETKMVMKKQL